MRVSQHSGREGNARHNDRSFMRDASAEERQAMAPNIKPGGAFLVWTATPEAEDLRAGELSFYRREYGAALDATNARYRSEGHAERVRTMEQVYTAKRTRPEETIIQIGDRNDGIDGDTFRECVNDYLRELAAWNRAHGGHMRVLNVAVHLDETTPHAHIRRIWDYTDGRDGVWRIGQGQALKLAGVELPKPNEPEGRYNNRKISFDTWARCLWQDIARAHGYQIETEPRPNARHKSKADYIAGQIRQEIDGLNRERDEAAREYADALDTARDIANGRNQAETVRRGIGKGRRDVVELAPDEYDRLQAATRAATIHADALRADKEEAERKAEALRRKTCGER